MFGPVNPDGFDLSCGAAITAEDLLCDNCRSSARNGSACVWSGDYGHIRVDQTGIWFPRI